jgi:acetate kinase
VRVLALNCGSSSLKFALYEGGGDALGPLARGAVRDIGGPSALEAVAEGARTAERVEAPDHAVAVGLVLEWLKRSGAGLPDAVAHRVVHGGTRFREPVRLDGSVLQAIEDAARLAPLHNAPALAAVRAAIDALGPDVPHTASFDTAFHRAMPEHAARYAIPPDLADRHGLVRYGFHGLAHCSMAERAAALLDRPLSELRLITLQLGAGCSAAAVEGGRSIDTTMGLTPLEGLVMATRSGDVDPTLPALLGKLEGLTAADVEALLNEQSGLLGLSGRSARIGDLLEAERAGDARSALAVEMFCYRVRKQIGAYLAALGGADAVVFGGGIGEHQPGVRERCCAGLEWLGLTLDRERNASRAEDERVISGEGSRIAVLVASVDEEQLLVRDALDCLGAD